MIQSYRNSMPHNMELRMCRVHRMILLCLLALFLFLQGNSTVRADALEIIFKDSLWGAAIGGVGGLAAWALQDKDGEDKVFPKYVSRYAAIGVFLGMGYGIFDANQGGDVFTSGTPSRSLIDYNPRVNLIIVRPSQFLPRLDFIGNQGRLSLKLLTASF